jgi:hypothetical protein
MSVGPSLGPVLPQGCLVLRIDSAASCHRAFATADCRGQSCTVRRDLRTHAPTRRRQRAAGEKRASTTISGLQLDIANDLTGRTYSFLTQTLRTCVVSEDRGRIRLRDPFRSVWRAAAETVPPCFVSSFCANVARKPGGTVPSRDGEVQFAEARAVSRNSPNAFPQVRCVP